MDLHAVLDRAITETAAVVRGVKPDQLDTQTPCSGWEVRDLTNHVLQVACALGLAGREQAVPGEVWGRDHMMVGDWADRFDDEARTASAAWAQPSAWQHTVDLDGMPMPAPMAVAMLVSDLAIHGWDLAKATGQPYRCDDEVAETTHEVLVATGEQGRQMGIYAASVPSPTVASPFVQALALSGRDPLWAPTTH